jgi:hypothetical protein
MPYKYRILDNHYTEKDKPTPQRGRRAKAENKAKDKELKKIGKIPSGIAERAYPKYPRESELNYMKRGLMDSGVKDVVNIAKSLGKGLGKIQNKAYKKNK